MTGDNSVLQQAENARGTPDLARFHHYKLVNGKEVPTSVFEYEVFCYIKENYPIFICGFPYLYNGAFDRPVKRHFKILRNK